MSNHKDLDKVPILTGSNWRIWELKMSAYLQLTGVWQLIEGIDHYPPNLPTTKKDATGNDVDIIPDPEKVEARRERQLAWRNRDDAARGAISMCIAPSLNQHMAAFSHQSWANLKKAHAQDTTSTIFTNFQSLIRARVGSGHPGPYMAEMWDLLERLEANKVSISSLMRALLLINALPPQLSQVGVIALQTEEKDDLSFTVIQQRVVTEYE